MLRISELSVSVDSEIVVDQYVPLTITWEALTPVSPVYWRTGDLKHSLIEIGIDPRSGHLSSITMTLIGPEVEQTTITAPDSLGAVEVGHPICDIGAWGSDVYVDCAASLRVHLFGDALRVLFGGQQIASSIVDGSVRFYLSLDRELIGFGIDCLSDGARARLADALTVHP